MQHVELQQCDAVEVVEHVVDREEVAGDVERRGAVGEARLVGDGCRGHDPAAGRLRRVIRSPDLGRQQLPQRLRAPEQPRCGVGADAHAVGAALERVSLGRAVGRAVGDDECDVGAILAGRGCPSPSTTGRAKPVAARACAAKVSATAAAPSPSATSRESAVRVNGSSPLSTNDAGAGMMPVTAAPFSSGSAVHPASPRVAAVNTEMSRVARAAVLRRCMAASGSL